MLAIDALRALWCYATRGHEYGVWEYHDRSGGRRIHMRACKRCAWIQTQRNYTLGDN